MGLGWRTAGSAAGWRDITEAAGLSSFRNTQGTAAKNYIVESIGGGCAFIDYNRDGKLDILLVRGSTLDRLKRGGDPVIALYENRGANTFVEVSAKAGLEAKGWGMGVVVADYDNDGWPDFLVTGLTRNFLFHNKGNRTFEEVAVQAGVARPGVWSTGAAFGDLDGDGLLDLYIAAYVTLDLQRLPAKGSGANCIYKGAAVFCGPRGMAPGSGALFHNLGSGKFEDITQTSGISGAAPPFYSLQPLIADLDSDGLADIFVANDSTPNYLFHNKGKLQFEEIGVASGTAVNMDGRAQAAMGVDLGDYNNDGLLDLVVTNFSEDTNTLYRNLGGGAFEDASWSSKIGPPSWLFLGWGVKFFDSQNSGLRDLVIANGHVYPEADKLGGSTYRQRLLFHRNRGDGTFAERGADEAAFAKPGTGRGLAVGDIDNDGRLDLLINHQDAAPELLRNEQVAGHWIEIALIGRASNRDGVGAMVTVKASGANSTAVRLAGDSYLSSSDPRLHFGLGSATAADSLTVKWPSGRTQTLGNVRADRVITIEEPSE